MTPATSRTEPQFAHCATSESPNPPAAKLASLFRLNEFAPLSRPISRPTSQHILLCAFLNFNLDCLSTTDNFRRLSHMIMEARYNEMKEKTQISKALYQSRHYTQCAKFNERLLSKVHNEVSARDDMLDSNYASGIRCI